MATLSRLRFPLLCLFIVALPLESLVDATNTYYYDWINHAWLVSHYGEFFRAHWTLPEVVHTTRIVGLAQTLFYSHTFYSIAGVISAITGPDAALRIVFLVLLAGQFYLVKRLFEAYSSNLTFSTVVATLVTWSTYPLTNLYNRGAITEFAAVCLLNMAVCALLIAPARSRPASIALPILGAALLFALAALTHPITGLLGGLVMALLFLFVVVVHRDRRWVVTSGIGAGLLMLAVLSPWLYALSAFERNLPADETSPLHVYPFDTFLGRISPFPFDIRSLMNGTTIETPYLDAQVCMTFVPLLIAVWLAFRPGRPSDHDSGVPPVFRRAVIPPATAAALTAIAMAAFLYGFTISLGWMPELVPTFIRRAQFGYRLITYLNICLLIVTLAATQYYAGRSFKRDAMLVGMAAAVALSFTSVVIKLTHGHVSRGADGPWTTSEERVTLPPTFYSLGDYTITAGLHESQPSSSAPAVTFTPLSGQRFAAIEPISLRLDREATVATNVASFPWNTVLVDSREVPETYYQTPVPGARPISFVSLVVPAGDHTLEYRFTPDAMWRLLRHLSTITLGVWALGMCGMAWWKERGRRPNE